MGTCQPIKSMLYNGKYIIIMYQIKVQQKLNEIIIKCCTKFSKNSNQFIVNNVASKKFQKSHKLAKIYRKNIYHKLISEKKKKQDPTRSTRNKANRNISDTDLNSERKNCLKKKRKIV